MTKGDVVQFNENSDWCGALGIIREVKVRFRSMSS